MSVPTTQTALVQKGYGTAKEQLSLSTSHPVSAPGSSQVQVKVEAASINPVDYKILHGNLKLVHSLKFPHVLGIDFAGVVTAVGSSVTRLKVGDEVYGASDKEHGAFGQYANVSEKYVSLKPKNLSFEQAATLPVCAVTALQALEKAGVSSGQKVVVIGASGGVGSFAVQLAKVLGASTVVGVCSGKNADFVKGLGCDSVHDYTTGKPSEGLSKDVDVVLDTVGGKEQWEEAQKILKPKGTFITVVGDDTEAKVNVGTILSTGAAVGGRKLSGLFGEKHHYQLFMVTLGYAVLDRITAFVVEDKLKTTIDQSFSLDEAGGIAMFEACESRRIRGKAVLEVGKAPTSSASEASSASSEPVQVVDASSSSSASGTDTTEKAGSASTDVATGTIAPSTEAPAAAHV